MEKRPFFWLLIKKQITSQKIEEFISNSDDKFGIVIYFEDVDKINPEILKLIHSKYRIPLAIYFRKNIEFKSSYRENFSEIIYLYNKNEETIFKKSGFISFKISNFLEQKSDGLCILNQLSDYFTLKGAFPKREAVLEIIDFKPQDNTSSLFQLIINLGIRNFIVPFSSENMLYLKNMDYETKSIDGKESIEIPVIDKWRKKIDILDNIMIDTLQQRLQIVSQMSKVKQKNNQPFFDAERWHEILSSRKKIAKDAGLDEQLIGEIFAAIHLDNLRHMFSESE